MRHGVSLTVLSDWTDPDVAFTRVYAWAENAFWLDDSLGTGWSYLGGGETVVTAVPDVEPSGHPTAGPDFVGGWVGWISYEGDARFVEIDRLVAFDHARHEVVVVAPDDEDGAEWVAAVALTLVDEGTSESPVSQRQAPHGSWRHDDDDYLAMIADCQRAIVAGDAYQLCLTNMWHSDEAVGEPIEVWRSLRASSPSHHGGYVRIGDTVLISSSPERFLTISPTGEASTSPIKGTRPRGDSPASDARRATELAESVKERAENLMIVDLMRNDLSRVSEVGSVRVDELLVVESYANVHQLVSTVTSRLASGVTVSRALEALFPAGSMTGAPKLSAIAILAALEKGPRGVFSGVFGFIGRDGATDLAMIIRSIVSSSTGTWIGAGGGITAMSVPAEELAEQKLKAAPMLAALRASPATA